MKEKRKKLGDPTGSDEPSRKNPRSHANQLDGEEKRKG